MTTRDIARAASAATLTLLCAAVGVQADEKGLKPIENSLVLDSAAAISASELSSSRGRQGFDTLQQMNQNDQRAWLEQNKLESGVTGDNVIESGALQDIEGIATVIQNTGNQVLIQESTLLNLTIAP